MRSLDSLKREEARLRARATELCAQGKWREAQTVRDKLLNNLNQQHQMRNKTESAAQAIVDRLLTEGPGLGPSEGGEETGSHMPAGTPVMVNFFNSMTMKNDRAAGVIIEPQRTQAIVQIDKPIRKRIVLPWSEIFPESVGESNPVSYGKAGGGNPVKGSKVAKNAGTQTPITGVGSDRKFAPALGMVQSHPENSEVKKQTRRKVNSEGIDWSARLRKMRERRGEDLETGKPTLEAAVPPPPDDEDTETFGGDWPPPNDKTAELAELWREDQAGEYIQINDDESAYYIAHGRAIEQIAPPQGQQTMRRATGIGKFSDEPTDESQTFRLIRAWMQKNNYSPNIWKVNDHGNVELHDPNGKPLGGLV
jgi:hypothetical protein